MDNDVKMTKSEDGQDLGYFNMSEVSDAIRGLGNVGAADLLPPLVGMIATIGGMLLIKKFVTHPTVNRFAPGIGAGIGVIASIPLAKWYGPQGVISGAVTSAAIGGSTMLLKELDNMGVPGDGATGLISVQRKRVGAVVAEGGGAMALPTARVPSGVGSAMDVNAYAGSPTY